MQVNGGFGSIPCEVFETEPTADMSLLKNASSFLMRYSSNRRSVTYRLLKANRGWDGSLQLIEGQNRDKRNTHKHTYIHFLANGISVTTCLQWGVGHVLLHELKDMRHFKGETR